MKRNSLLKEYSLNLEDDKDLISKLEEIASIHSKLGIIYTTQIFRSCFRQYPLDVKAIHLNSNNKEDISLYELKEIIKQNKNACFIIYHHPKTNKIVQQFFLPESIEDNPLIRGLI